MQVTGTVGELEDKGEQKLFSTCFLLFLQHCFLCCNLFWRGFTLCMQTALAGEEVCFAAL